MRVRYRHPTIRRATVAFAAISLFGLAASRAQTSPDKPEPKPPLANGNEVAVQDDTVDLHVVNMPLAEVLRMLSLRGKRNIVASPGVTGTVTADLYHVAFNDALSAILIPNGAGYRVQGDFIYVYTQDELAAKAKNEVPETRVFTLNYISAEDAKQYIEPVVGDKYKKSISTSPAPSTGLESTATDAGGLSHAAQDFVIITAPRPVLDRVGKLLAQLDVRPKQVLVEATILRADLDDSNSLGVDFTVVGGVDLQNLNATSNAVKDLSLGQLPSDRLQKLNAIGQTDFTGGVPDGGLTVGIIKDRVAMFIRALEEVTDTSVIANPKVLTLNRQKGQVIVGRRDGYITTTITETQAMQTVQFLETGTQLVFRPFIGDDGFIRVELYPKDSVGFISAQGLPSEQTTEVTTNVIIRDGETILIGGLFREVTTDRRSQVPGFGGLPIIGNLFRSRGDTTTREEVIILLTIKVVKDHDGYAKASKDAMDYARRVRVGIRHGLMWTGRERLAQFNYGHAIKAAEAGHHAIARWYNYLALQNLPRYEPALELQRRLTNKSQWDDEGAPTRWFIYDLIAKDRGYQTPRYNNPGPLSPHVPNASPEPPGDDATDKPGH